MLSRLVTLSLLLLTVRPALAERDWRRTALGPGPSDEIVREDIDGDGQADVQAFAISKNAAGQGAHWMLFIDVEKDGVLGWVDWETMRLENWAYTGRNAWLPDYNGDSIFLKIHADPAKIDDLS